MTESPAPSDAEIVNAMACYGGSFVQSLADAAQKADAENFARIKAAWPELWQQYAEVVVLRRQRALGNPFDGRTTIEEQP